MGNPNPRAFSRGKRGIAGSMVFTVFDRDALKSLKSTTTVYRQGMNDSGTYDEDGNFIATDLVMPHAEMSASTNRDAWIKKSNPHYSDEIPPLTLRA